MVYLFIITKSNNWYPTLAYQSTDHIFCLYIVNIVIERCEDKKSVKQDKWNKSFNSNDERMSQQNKPL